jgi:hypothetical protein
MALPVNRPLNIERVYAHLADSSTAGSAWAVAPCRGKVVRLGSIIGGVVATANNVLTFETSRRLFRPLVTASWLVTSWSSSRPAPVTPTLSRPRSTLTFW